MRWRSPHLLQLLLWITLLICTAASSGFTICSYNVQRFTINKAKSYKVIHTLTRVLSRCDLALLQHVVDPDGKAIAALLKSLNRYDDFSYKSVASKALGTSAEDMQKYVFIYRVETVNVTGQDQYKGKQKFVRPPFAIQVQSNKTAIKSFILVPLHSDPDQAAQEIDWLYDVFLEVSKKWNNKNVMFLGDFHAACAYVTRTTRKSIRLYKNSNFSWLIGDKVDTTVSEDTNCAYDRIVVHGEPFLKTIQPFSAGVFDVGKEFKLTKNKVLELSDHHPLKVVLKSSALFLRATPPWLLLSLSLVLRSLLFAL
ncbi:deoxyribonuclease-1-like 1 isoform X2 [Salarias fasciatus]|uniref:Deoxyribonuclease n=1 Tax=Salarias fasciatus TaxID=181472 RepID=A0A672GV81_SALFA|nr:deoxyribonuclease-1-like 1 isoform X2 [Salarias fasciatus]